MTEGQRFAKAARQYFKIGPRTRRFRGLRDLHAEVCEAVFYAATAPGYYSDEMQADLRLAFAAVNGYEKHIRGFRASPAVVNQVSVLSAWRFVDMLARMIDAGVTNNGEAERFFQKIHVHMA